MSQRNLILVHRGQDYVQDFDEIAGKVNALDRGITVYHLPAALNADLPHGAWQHPTLTVSLSSKFRITVRRGPILSNRPIGKLDQQGNWGRFPGVCGLPPKLIRVRPPDLQGSVCWVLEYRGGRQGSRRRKP